MTLSQNPETLLLIEDLHVAYGATEVLHGVNLEVKRGEIVSLIGSNGAGKSTILKSLFGVPKAKQGRNGGNGDGAQRSASIGKPPNSQDGGRSRDACLLGEKRQDKQQAGKIQLPRSRLMGDCEIHAQKGKHQREHVDPHYDGP